MRKREYSMWFAAGAIAGLVAGLVVAFILAPQSGHQTRNLLKDKVHDAGGRVKEISGNRKKIYTRSWQKRVGRYRTNRYTQAHV